jgi:hypothetical protein
MAVPGSAAVKVGMAVRSALARAWVAVPGSEQAPVWMEAALVPAEAAELAPGPATELDPAAVQGAPAARAVVSQQARTPLASR